MFIRFSAVAAASSLLLVGCTSMDFGGSSSGSLATVARKVQSFDPDWRFSRGDAAGAEKPGFDDSAWRKLDVPHDWSIEGPFDQAAPARGAGAFLPSGVAWYRKHFTLPADAKDKNAFIEFDGVMANSEVWINGVSLGKRPFGYSSFQYEMTGHLNYGPGSENVLVVKADTQQQPASRWYAGAGIYRHVRMTETSPVHVDHWGTFVTTPQVAAEQATVHVRNTIINEGKEARSVSVQTLLIGPNGTTTSGPASAAKSIAPGQTADFEQDIAVAKPAIWDPASPNMYQARTTVMDSGKVVDDQVNPFGIRSFEFKTDTGFWMNGKNFKLLGVCLHADGGAVGMAVPLGVWERRLEALREVGANAIRTAHNPPAPEFLDLCDRMGFLVMDESFDCWDVAKNPFDYHLYFDQWSKIDIRDYVMRDRNHPSIVLYSSGNEIHDTPQEEKAKGILRGLVDTFHEYDPTRPVTQALFRPNASHDYTNGLADMLDVIGTNYRDVELIQAWKDKPGRKIVGTEQQHGRDTWLNLRDNPQHSGQFLWSGIDYLGEAFWPTVSAQSGLLDRTGMIKTMGYERQAWWSTKPVVRIVRADTGGGGARGAAPAAPAEAPATGPTQVEIPIGGQEAQTGPAARGGARGARGARGGAAAGGGGARRGGPVADWTPRNGEPGSRSPVTIHSNCEEVELFLNGQSLGSKNRNADDAPRTWDVAYQPGTIKAVGKNGGKIVATDELKTAGKPSRVELVADRRQISPGWDEVVFVTATIVDDQGVRCPQSQDTLAFTVAGPGTIMATDNGDPANHISFPEPNRAAFGGRAVAIVKAGASSGRVTVRVAASGLQGSEVSLPIVAANAK